MLLMIDNYDSFTFNIALYFKELGVNVMVMKNDGISIADINDLSPDQIVISPGPGTPAEAGISIPAIKAFMGRIPILGVCLGHQCIGEVFGGRVVEAQTVMHGKTSSVHHHRQGVFSGLPTPFSATRYHSLVLDSRSLPDAIDISAWTESASGARGDIMGIKHRQFVVEGVQFHPESIMSEHGHALFNNFLEQSMQNNPK